MTTRNVQIGGARTTLDAPLESFKIGNRPAASKYKGEEVFIRDMGTTGATCVSNGTSWIWTSQPSFNLLSDITLTPEQMGVCSFFVAGELWKCDGSVFKLYSKATRQFGNTIVLLGDSITANNNLNNGLSGASHSQTNYVTQDCGIFTQANILLNNPFRVLKNAGVSGDTTAMMLARLQTDVLAYSPQWVYFMGGINDIIQGVSSATTIENIKYILDTLVNSNIKVVACTLLPNNYVSNSGTTYPKRYVFRN